MPGKGKCGCAFVSTSDGYQENGFPLSRNGWKQARQDALKLARKQGNGQVVLDCADAPGDGLALVKCDSGKCVAYDFGLGYDKNEDNKSFAGLSGSWSTKVSLRTSNSTGHYYTMEFYRDGQLMKKVFLTGPTTKRVAEQEARKMLRHIVSVYG